ncbi:MAG: hypothetical protein A2583_03210 [Bdellovibrionales bacterium RIFOXYD1_FULL_53_11]|nr:MAG: hypothetical protein A2583_03210 [Bdellovibrionales bacterium RIFOXYD1_FULL_53_11]
MTVKNNIKAKKLDFKMATPEEVCRELGLRLRAHRLARNIKQQELAGMAGVSTGTVKNLESHGQSSLDTLVRIAAALDLVQDFESLFEVRINSIAQMEQIEKITSGSLRRRAR